MLFSSYLGKTLAAGVTLLGVASAVQVTSQLSDCEGIDFYSQAPWFGESPGGERFCFSQIYGSGTLPMKIEMMSEKIGKWHSVIGMKVTYTNHDFSIVGSMEKTEDRTYREISWNPENGDIIDYAYGEDWDDAGGWMNVLKIKTKQKDGGSQFACGGFDDHGTCKDEKSTDKFSYASGTMLAISGAYGEGGIELIKFWMLWEGDEVKDSTIEEIEFTPSLDDINSGMNGGTNITQRTLMTAYCQNELDTNVTFATKNTFQYRKDTIVSHSSTNTFSAGYSFSWGTEIGMEPIKSKAQHEVSFGWETSTTNTNTEQTGEWETREYGPSSIIVEPNSAVKVTAYVMQGELNLAWKGWRKINLHNKPSFRLPVTGSVQAVRYSESWHFVEPANMTSLEGQLLGDNEFMLPAAEKDKISNMNPANLTDSAPPKSKDGDAQLHPPPGKDSGKKLRRFFA